MSTKFKKHDLIGVPFQIIIGSKTEGNKFEFKEIGKEIKLLNLTEITTEIKK